MNTGNFNGRVVVIGCGSVSQCVLPLLVECLKLPATAITVLDFVDNRPRIQALIEQGLQYHMIRVEPDNYQQVLGQYLTSGDLLIDLGWNIETEKILEWCRDSSVLYVNTSVEVWDPYADTKRSDPRPYTLYERQMALRKMVHRWGSNRGATAVVDHGANPGLVSHFTKRALLDIGTRIVETKPKDVRRTELERALSIKDFKTLARLSNTQVIHISERDTQITTRPKAVNEFVNTWSVEGVYEEGVAPAEMGWGTHERTLPPGAAEFEEGPRNNICLCSLGVNTWVRSWVPSGSIVGMVIRHGEAFGISDRLTTWNGDKAIYRPTVHYVYCPSDSAIASLHELKMRQYKIQPTHRILNDEISGGHDELGVLLMGHDFNAWWTGSILDIDEARRLVPGQNATTVQVAISVVAAAQWMFDNPTSGLCLPDDIDHEEILKVALPYLGEFVSKPSEWNPLSDLDLSLMSFDSKTPSAQDMWQFSTFAAGTGLGRS